MAWKELLKDDWINNIQERSKIYSSIKEESSDFESHWDFNESEKIPSEKFNAADKFLRFLIEETKAKNGIRVLDAGCGDGVHGLYLKDIDYLKGKEFFAVDISWKALYITKNRLGSSVNLLQADLANLPLKSSTINAIFSYGVLGYTSDPKKSFDELVRVLAKEGLIGIWLYPKSKSIGFKVFQMVRALCKSMGRRFTVLLANILVPFLGMLPTSSNLSVFNANWKQCREIILVNIAPAHLNFYELHEIENWFIDAGLDIVEIDDKNPVTIWGKKR